MFFPKLSSLDSPHSQGADKLILPQALEVRDKDQPAFGNEFLQVLRLIIQAACNDDAPPLAPSDHMGDNIDHLQIKLGGWDENNGEITMDLMRTKMNRRSSKCHPSSAP
ncbi:hypothetical protein L2E82_03949 [Cichorium intybus]|uniref:Uncharacterized protein n=1 Tax=Cichorium intybus TaxID=13427 RepID=A0ACB9H618_CICIN|nr:hypothetical protein L2E82_03949 [Cichorium intybus]